jgi:uncharacterized protein YeaO (DUF488 family)
MRIRIKRVYETASAADGRRILVDRLWPRGLSRDDARIDFWAKSVAPSDALRRWYGHDAKKWPEFKRRYFAELDANAEGLDQLLVEAGEVDMTLLFGSKELLLNNAAALKEYLESRLGRGARKNA